MLLNIASLIDMRICILCVGISIAGQARLSPD